MATAVLNKNGKRQRGDMESDDTEFVPLSKRINNLHLQQFEQGMLLDGHQVNNNYGHHPTHQNELNHSNGHFDRTESCSAERAMWQNAHANHHSQQQQHRTVESHQVSHGGHYGASNGFPSEDSNSSEAYSRGLPSPQNPSDLHNGSYSNVPSPMSNFPHGVVNQQSCNYNPVLSPEANPHYYETNKQLYNLYLERMNRQGKQLHPHFQEHH